MNKGIRFALAGLIVMTAAVSGAGTTVRAAESWAAEEAVEASWLVPDGKYTGVTKTELNLRKDTSTSASSILLRIPQGAVVVLESRMADGWYKVKYKDTTGYVKNAYVSENTDVLTTTSSLRLRSSMTTSSSSNILMTIPEGKEVEVVERNSKWKNWIKINYRGITGYASKLYLKSASEIAEEQKKQEAEKAADEKKKLEEEKKKLEEQLKKIEEEKAATIDLLEVKFENIEVAYDGKNHSLPKVKNLPEGVGVIYSSSGKHKNIGTYTVKAAFYATAKGKKLVNATPRVAHLKIYVEEKAVYEVGALKYQVTDKNIRGYGTVSVKAPVKKSAKTVKIPEAIRLGGIRFTVTAVEKNAFKGCSKLTSVVVGPKVTDIGASAFANCTALTTVTLGDSVASIGSKAFYKDSKLKTVTITSEKLKTVGSSALKGIHKNAVIRVPAEKVKKYTRLLEGKGQGKQVTIQ